MTIHQLSIFIENKNGALLQVLELLKQANIQIVASTISDTVDYGIYRIICSNPSKAYQLLQQQGLSVTMTDVFALELTNTPGEAAKAISLFTVNNINISYMYSFLLNDKGIIIFKTTDNDKTREVISLNKLTFIGEEQLTSLNTTA